MDRETTVETQSLESANAPLLDTGAPVAPVANAPTFVPATSGQKRHKTAGEFAFDIATYGGFSFLGNEALSTYIMNETAPKGIFHKMYDATATAVKKIPLLNKLEYVGSGRAAYLLWATVGGFILVLPVKWLEDRKGDLVRALDNMFHGGKADSDPQMEAAHKEMDAAPKQSWSSLWDGRVVTVGSALAMDSLIGWPKAPIAKLFDKPGKLNDYAGIDRLSASFARWMGKTFDPSKREAINNVLATVHDVEKRYSIDPKIEGNFTKTVSIASMVMTISGALTLLFYVTSKAFAKKQHDKKNVSAPTPVAETTHAQRDDASDPLEATQEDIKDQKKTPTSRVASVENLSRVTDLAQHVTV